MTLPRYYIFALFQTLPADSPYIKPTENLKAGLSDIRRKSQPKIKESPAGNFQKCLK